MRVQYAPNGSPPTRPDSATSVRHTDVLRICLFGILALSLARPTHARQEEPQPPQAPASATSSGACRGNISMVRLIYIAEDGRRWADPRSLGVQPNLMG